MEMRLNTDVVDALRKHEADIESLIKKGNQKDVSMLRMDEKIMKIEQTVKDYVDLIDSLNEKQTLSEELITKTRSQTTQRLQLLQKQILETLSGGGAQADVSVSLNAYEETIEKLE